jgi:hypothetical protein
VASRHIQNDLPIHLLHLPSMKLVHRSAVQKHVFHHIKEMVKVYFAPQYSNSPIQKREAILKAVKEKTAYAIFSHRWLVKGELTFQDLSKLESISAAGFRRLIKSHRSELNVLRGAALLEQAKVYSAEENVERNGWEVLKEMQNICAFMSDEARYASDFVKLVRFCEEASRRQCDFVWLDTGCIDKQSSAELEESIRSMFSWYRNSKICVVHLSETSSPYNMGQDGWFRRGWTLQELLAPKEIKFFSKRWKPITVKPNDKISDLELGRPLWKTISTATRIPVDQLLNFQPGINSVSERMVWASSRETTRIEDMAYCLIGIFNVPLSIAYGEGRMAFHRLQVEIVQRSHDRGLFLWNGLNSAQSLLNSMFAAGPEAFRSKSLLAGEDIAGSADPTYALTNYGLRILLSIYDMQRIEEQNHDRRRGVIGYKLKVQEFEDIGFEVDAEFPIENQKVTIGILGNIPGNKSLAIVLIPLNIGLYRRQFKRITTYNACEVIRQPRFKKWKEPELIFIE